jgi:hypothetical protein
MEARYRKITATCPFGRRFSDHRWGAEASGGNYFLYKISLYGPSRKRDPLLRHISWQNVLADFAGEYVSLSGKLPPGLEGRLWTALLIVTTVGFIKLRSRRYLIVGWLFFLGTLVPVIGLVQVGDQARADRYVYLPLPGLFVITAWAVADLFASKKIDQPGLAIVGAVLLLAFSIVTYRQIGYW